MSMEYTEIEPVTAAHEKGTSFSEIKEVASKNINSLLKDLQEFEVAIREENIQAIYRIYNGRLHKELKETSNQNHEIDELLSRKFHESLISNYPFMKQVEKKSATVYLYQIDTYYRERPTILMDVSIPALSILPEVQTEWENPPLSIGEDLQILEEKMDQIEAKKINAKIAIEEIDRQLQILKNERLHIENNKGFFNRGKIDEDLEEIQKKQDLLNKEKENWLPYLTGVTQINQEKEQLIEAYEAKRLKRAIITKELRLISKHFGSYTTLVESLESFLQEYLKGKGEKGNE
ncbi:viral A-type inclusion protein [Enterococcus sp. LJL98]